MGGGGGLPRFNSGEWALESKGSIMTHVRQADPLGIVGVGFLHQPRGFAMYNFFPLFALCTANFALFLTQFFLSKKCRNCTLRQFLGQEF